MNAADAKKAALTNKKQMEDNLKLKQQKAKNADVILLLNHFNTKIEEAVNKGRLSIDVVEFPIDRFSDDIVREVAEHLQIEGYRLSMEKHNAYHTIKFNIGWA